MNYQCKYATRILANLYRCKLKTECGHKRKVSNVINYCSELLRDPPVEPLGLGAIMDEHITKRFKERN